MGYPEYCDRPHIREYQARIGQWSDYNFGGVDTGPAGLVEEIAELFTALSILGPAANMCQAWVKRTQGIRGTDAEWTAKMRKEAADVAIKLMQVCHDEGIDLEEAIAERWEVVGMRDFRANPLGHGMPTGS